MLPPRSLPRGWALGLGAGWALARRRFRSLNRPSVYRLQYSKPGRVAILRSGPRLAAPGGGVAWRMAGKITHGITISVTSVRAAQTTDRTGRAAGRLGLSRLNRPARPCTQHTHTRSRKQRKEKYPDPSDRLFLRGLRSLSHRMSHLIVECVLREPPPFSPCPRSARDHSIAFSPQLPLESSWSSEPSRCFLIGDSTAPDEGAALGCWA